VFPYLDVGKGNCVRATRATVKWQNMTSNSLAEWANMTLEARVLDLIADIVFAADEARTLLEIETAPPPSNGLTDALARISTEANALIERLGSSRRVTAGDPTRYPYTRDSEVAELLQAIRQRIEALEAIRGPERDEALVLVEAYAAPYALALFYEVNRLDSLIPRLLRDALAGTD
jgi:hypothetical protein